MRPKLTDVTGLPHQWKAVRTATTITILVLGLTFLVGSMNSVVRPNCCASEHGLTCSSCGITRSVIAAINGKFEDSLKYHSGGLWITGFLLLSTAARPIPYVFNSPSVILADAIGFLVGWLLLAVFIFGVPGFGYRTGSNPNKAQQAKPLPAVEL